jgi:D-alanyl-D-alanine carboxypeptidase/D-alanyl-D-alanine-endopeptidase (penicillin-binding protein 4)
MAVNDGFSTYPPADKSNVLAKPASDPAQLAAATLRDLLTQAGIRVTGSARSGRAPEGATEVAAIESAPLKEVVGQMLAASDNTTAELLTKEIGVKTAGQGTTAAGVAASLQILQRVQLANGVVLNDGSGLDRGDRLSCDVLAAVLDRAGAEPAIVDGLPVAGQKGTLRDRLVGTPAAGKIRAKTGSVRNARSLAGFARSNTPEQLVFAYIANQDRIDGNAALAIQDRLALELVTYPQGPSVDQLGPLPPSVGDR